MQHFSIIVMNSRRVVFFEPLLEAILPHLSRDEEKFIVDIGCGEGSHLSWLSKRVKAPLCGMDIAKEGIHQASVHFGNQALFFLGDLANLPFTDESCGTLLNILTPSNYQEFMRVLAPGGTFVKVIPGNDYLTELRQQLYRSNPEKQTYSNADILRTSCSPNALKSRLRGTLHGRFNRRNLSSFTRNDAFILGSKCRR